MSNVPHACRQEAFDLFVRALDDLETNQGLLLGAVAVARHSRPDADPDQTARRLADLADRVRGRISHPLPPALLAHLHAVLFEQEQFSGNLDDYYSPDNSFLPSVLETRRGIPITLVLVYKLVAEQLGLRVEGVNSPGHFLARVHAGDETLLVDPFFHGQMLTQDEAFERISQVTGRPEVQADALLQTATHAQWLSRLLANLQNIFAARGQSGDLAAMSELQALLEDQLF